MRLTAPDHAPRVAVDEHFRPAAAGGCRSRPSPNRTRRCRAWRRDRRGSSGGSRRSRAEDVAALAERANHLVRPWLAGPRRPPARSDGRRRRAPAAAAPSCPRRESRTAARPGYSFTSTTRVRSTPAAPDERASGLEHERETCAARRRRRSPRHSPRARGRATRRRRCPGRRRDPRGRGRCRRRAGRSASATMRCGGARERLERGDLGSHVDVHARRASNPGVAAASR